MDLSEWTTKPLIRWSIAVVAPLALAFGAHLIDAPAFALDDITVLLVVGIAFVSGLGAASLTAVLVVIADNVTTVPLRGQLPLTATENIVDLALLVGVAAVVHRLVMRARQAQEAAEQAAERERRVREERERVVATVAHDLATPLTVVRGTVQAAKRVRVGQDPAEDRLFRRLETAAARASSLVNTLSEVRDLDVVRPDRIRPVDLRQLLRAAAEMMQVSDHHAIVVDVPDVDVPVEADGERLHRVFENVLNNAIKYSPAGGEITVSVRQQHDRASVIIRDHGIGITPQARELIFDLSYRAPEAATASSGRGLGLHIAAQIVSAHGGTIAAHPASGQGTEIVIDLPTVNAHTSGVAHDTQANRSSRMLKKTAREDAEGSHALRTEP